MKLSVKEVMTSSVVTIHADAKIDEAFALFLRHQISGLPIVDDENRLVGVVSRRDVVRFIRDVRMKIASVLERRRHLVQPHTLPT